MAESVYPKIELHVHLEGTVRPATLLEIARRNDQPLPAETVEGLTALYEFTDLAHFVQVWLLTTACLRTATDFRQVVVDYAGEAAAFGAVYLEGIFSPGERVKRGVRWDEIFTGYAEGAVEAFERHGVTVRSHRIFTGSLIRSSRRSAPGSRSAIGIAGSSGWGLAGGKSGTRPSRTGARSR